MEKNIEDIIYQSEKSYYSVLKAYYKDSFKKLEDRLGYELTYEDFKMLIEFCRNTIPSILYLDINDNDFEEALKQVNISRNISGANAFDDIQKKRMIKEMKKITTKSKGSILKCLKETKIISDNIILEIKELNYTTDKDTELTFYEEMYHAFKLLAFVEYRKAVGLNYSLGRKDDAAVSTEEMDFVLSHCKPTNINRRALGECLYEYISKHGYDIYKALRYASSDEQREYMYWIVIFNQRQIKNIVDMIVEIIE